MSRARIPAVDVRRAERTVFPSGSIRCLDRKSRQGQIPEYNRDAKRPAKMIKRMTCQSRCDLYEFYQDLADSTDETTAKIGMAMNELLGLLDASLEGQTVWGLTSLHSLGLHSIDDYTSPWYVSIEALPDFGFRVSYRMPESEYPWPYAEVQGIAKAHEDASQMIRIGCDKSNGWVF